MGKLLSLFTSLQKSGVLSLHSACCRFTLCGLALIGLKWVSRSIRNLQTSRKWRYLLGDRSLFPYPPAPPQALVGLNSRPGVARHCHEVSDPQENPRINATLITMWTKTVGAGRAQIVCLSQAGYARGFSLHL